jgi:hypothetical protein
MSLRQFFEIEPIDRTLKGAIGHGLDNFGFGFLIILLGFGMLFGLGGASDTRIGKGSIVLGFIIVILHLTLMKS